MGCACVCRALAVGGPVGPNRHKMHRHSTTRKCTATAPPVKPATRLGISCKPRNRTGAHQSGCRAVVSPAPPRPPDRRESPVPLPLHALMVVPYYFRLVIPHSVCVGGGFRHQPRQGTSGGGKEGKQKESAFSVPTALRTAATTSVTFAGSSSLRPVWL